MYPDVYEDPAVVELVKAAKAIDALMELSYPHVWEDEGKRLREAAAAITIEG